MTTRFIIGTLKCTDLGAFYDSEEDLPLVCTDLGAFCDPEPATMIGHNRFLRP